MRRQVSRAGGRVAEQDMRTNQTWSYVRRLAMATAMALPVCLAVADAGRACDTEMICAWKRTFYTYNYLYSPLRPYNMPRIPNCNCWGTELAEGAACQLPTVPLAQGFERLGRIPNDVDLSVAAPSAAPGR
jgi:hypothetical protein